LKPFLKFHVYIDEGELTMSNKKLYRKPNEQMIAGVCAGLAEYLGLDLTVVRLLFVLLFFLGGNGILIYVILWILTPVQPPYIEGEFKDQ
jgi:phage shock protein PspC (stress-responsive transcriptional regulator)